MGTLRNIREQMVTLVIPIAAAVVETANVETDINYDKVVGLFVTSTNDLALLGSNFQNFEIGNRKIFDKGHQAKMLTAGQNTAPDERWYRKIDEKAQGSSVNISYQDGSVIGTVYPYTVTVYLWLQNPKSDENAENAENKSK